MWWLGSYSTGEYTRLTWTSRTGRDSLVLLFVVVVVCWLPPASLWPLPRAEDPETACVVTMKMKRSRQPRTLWQQPWSM